MKESHYDDYDAGWEFREDSIIEDYHVEIIDLDQVKPESAGEDVSQFDMSTLPKSKHLLFEWQRSITHKQVRSFLTICLVLLLLGVGFLSAFGGFTMFSELGTLITGSRKLPMPSNVNAQQFPMNIAASKVLLPQTDGFVCLSDSAWSPDSRYIAIVGYRRTCMMDGLPDGTGVVGIYDILTGKLVSRIQPDVSVLQSLHNAAPHLTSKPIINYTQVLWSPQGNRIAITFTIQFSQTLRSQITYTTAYNGVIVVDEDGSNMQVMLHAQTSNITSAEWDIVRQTALPQPTILAKATPSARALSPATIYMWGSNGTLIPEQFDDSQPSQLVPIGNPAGGNAFTIWQPGVVILNNILEDSAAATGPGVYTLDSNFGAWSPDGRYLVSTQVESRLEFSGEPQPTQQALNALNVSQLPLLQVRDKALQHVLNTLSGPATSTNLFMTSWRPDGSVLAVYDASSTDLDIYDCDTGYQVDSLLLSTKTVNSNLNGSYLLRWSPDGEHLILFDPEIGSIILWNVPA